MKQGKGQGMQFILPAADHTLHCSSLDTVQFSSIIILVIVMSMFFIQIEACLLLDKGLSYLLKSQTELEFLHLKLGLTHVNLTDKSLAVLHSPKLTSVKLEALDQVTNSGIITLVKNCPNICMLMVPRCNLLSDGCFQTLVALLKGKLVSNAVLLT